jgi:hypothetical protein
LPYGIWNCADYDVLFDRNYCPLWIKRHSDGRVERADPNQFHDWTCQWWLYDDHNPPERNREVREWLRVILDDFVRGAT